MRTCYVLVAATKSATVRVTRRTHCSVCVIAHVAQCARQTLPGSRCAIASVADARPAARVAVTIAGAGRAAGVAADGVVIRSTLGASQARPNTPGPTLAVTVSASGGRSASGGICR